MGEPAGQTGEWKAVVVRMPVTHVLRYRMIVLSVLTPCVAVAVREAYVAFSARGELATVVVNFVAVLVVFCILGSWLDVIALTRQVRSEARDARLDRARGLPPSEHPVLAAEAFAERAGWSPRSFERLRFEDAQRTFAGADLPNVWLDEPAAFFIGHPLWANVPAPAEGRVKLERACPLGWSKHLWVVALLGAITTSVLVGMILLETVAKKDPGMVVGAIVSSGVLLASVVLFLENSASSLVVIDHRPCLRRWGRRDVAITPVNAIISITSHPINLGEVGEIRMTLAVKGCGVFRTSLNGDVPTWAWWSDVLEVARAWMAGSTRVRCIACGYSLMGLPVESPCPECGAARDFLPAGLAPEGGGGTLSDSASGSQTRRGRRRARGRYHL